MLERSVASLARTAIGAVGISSVVLLGGGCTQWVMVPHQEIRSIDTTWEQSRVSYSNGTVIELTKGRLAYPMLHGEIAGLQSAEIPNPLRRVDVGIQTAIDLRLVKTVEVLQPAPQHTGLLVTGIVLGGAGIITGFVFLGIFASNAGSIGVGL